jgi:SHS2 domain-containing protein
MNRNLKFEFFDVTADVGFRAYGKTMEEAFQNAASAMFDVITDVTKINPSQERKVVIESEDTVALLFDWLSELIFLHDSQNMIFSKFKLGITQKSHDLYILNGSAWGEILDRDKHEIRDDVKAVTYHLMKIEENKGFMVQVILDT